MPICQKMRSGLHQSGSFRDKLTIIVIGIAKSSPVDKRNAPLANKPACQLTRLIMNFAPMKISY